MSHFLEHADTSHFISMAIIFLYPFRTHQNSYASPPYPWHKVLAFLLSRSGSLQVYTLALQVREVVRWQRYCCYHPHGHRQTGPGAWWRGTEGEKQKWSLEDNWQASTCEAPLHKVSKKQTSLTTQNTVNQLGGSLNSIQHFSSRRFHINMMLYQPFWSEVECLSFCHSF